MTENSESMVVIPASAQAMAEAESLSAEILEDIQLSRVKLSITVLKAVRLARLLNDFDFQQIFEWEGSGYPGGQSGVPRDVWKLGQQAGRTFFYAAKRGEEKTERMFMESIERLEHSVELAPASLAAAQDPSVSVSSANQHQRVSMPHGNAVERNTIRRTVQESSQRLSSRRTLIYGYAARKYYELKFSAVADDVFGRVRASVDASIGVIVPDAVRKFTAVYSYLASDNPEDWANAAHSCRRVLQDLADALFPAVSETRTRMVNGKTIAIKLGPDHYINRLLAYLEDMSYSERYEAIVGSHLSFVGDRLDAMFKAAQKGSHASVTRDEANRCVVYTYLLVGDILTLAKPQPHPADTENRNDSVLEPLAEIDAEPQAPQP